MQTSYKYFKNSRTWNEWLQLPVLIGDCPINSQVAITIWDLSPLPENDPINHAVPFGGTTVPLFDKDGTLQKGRQKCKVYRHRAADGCLPSSTPHIPKPKRRRKKEDLYAPTPEEEELERLEKLFKKHEMNEIPRVDWLDKLVFQAVAKKNREAEDAARKRAALRKTSKKDAKAAKDTPAPKQNGPANHKANTLDDEDDSESTATTTTTTKSDSYYTWNSHGGIFQLSLPISSMNLPRPSKNSCMLLARLTQR